MAAIVSQNLCSRITKDICIYIYMYTYIYVVYYPSAYIKDFGELANIKVYYSALMVLSPVFFLKAAIG